MAEKTFKEWLDAHHTGIANAIRTKEGSTEKIEPEDFEQRILDLPSGGEVVNAQEKEVKLESINQSFFPDPGYNYLSKLKINSIRTSLETFTIENFASIIKQGESILGIEGNYTGIDGISLDTSSVNVDFSKLPKSYLDISNLVPNSNKYVRFDNSNGSANISYAGKNANIDFTGATGTISLENTGSLVFSGGGLDISKIADGETILGVTGNFKGEGTTVVESIPGVKVGTASIDIDFEDTAEGIINANISNAISESSIRVNGVGYDLTSDIEGGAVTINGRTTTYNINDSGTNSIINIDANSPTIDLKSIDGTVTINEISPESINSEKYNITNLSPENIANGVWILGKQGTFKGTSFVTQDKEVESITHLPFTIYPDVATGGSLPNVMRSVTIRGVSPSIDPYIKPEYITSDASILGVPGGVTRPIPTTLQVSPEKVKRTYVPENGYNFFSEVVVDKVTASIDSYIKPYNIKKYINVLGVEGTYEGLPASVMQGVAIDPSGYIGDKNNYVYINRNISISSLNSICNQLTFQGERYFVWSDGQGSGFGENYLAIVKNVNSYEFEAFINGNPKNDNEIDEILEFTTTQRGVESITMMGQSIPVGQQNNLLSSIVSNSPFETNIDTSIDGVTVEGNRVYVDLNTAYSQVDIVNPQQGDTIRIDGGVMPSIWLDNVTGGQIKLEGSEDIAINMENITDNNRITIVNYPESLKSVIKQGATVYGIPGEYIEIGGSTPGVTVDGSSITIDNSEGGYQGIDINGQITDTEININSSGSQLNLNSETTINITNTSLAKLKNDATSSRTIDAIDAKGIIAFKLDDSTTIVASFNSSGELTALTKNGTSIL